MSEPDDVGRRRPQATDQTRTRRGAGRARRGDVQTAILALLVHGDMHGYQIIQELAERSGGRWQPGAGSIYPNLRSLQEQGMISSRAEDAKRVFSLTPRGRRLADGSRSEAPWQQFAEPDGTAVKLRKQIASLAAAVAQVERTGSDAQLERAVTLISDTRKAVYLMLAEEDI